MTTDQLLAYILGIKILDTGTKLIIVGNTKELAHDSSWYRGYVRIEVNGVTLKVWERTNSLVLRRHILKHINIGLRLKDAYPMRIKRPFYELVNKIIEMANSEADNGSEYQEQKDAEIDAEMDKRQAKRQKDEYEIGLNTLENLFKNTLADISEDKLIEIFRLTHIRLVMES